MQCATAVMQENKLLQQLLQSSLVTPWTKLICMWIYSQTACFIYSYSQKHKSKTSTLTTSPVQDTKKHYMHTEACAWLCNKIVGEKKKHLLHTRNIIFQHAASALSPHQYMFQQIL